MSLRFVLDLLLVRVLWPMLEGAAFARATRCCNRSSLTTAALSDRRYGMHTSKCSFILVMLFVDLASEHAMHDCHESCFSAAEFVF